MSEELESRADRLNRLRAELTNAQYGFNKTVDILVEIKRESLQKEAGYDSFDEWVAFEYPQIYKRCKSRVSQLITASEVISDIKESQKFNNSDFVKLSDGEAPPLPENPRQAYELKDVPAEQRGEAWAEVLEKAQEEGVKPTADFIKKTLTAKEAKQQMADSRAELGIAEPVKPERVKDGGTFFKVTEIKATGRFIHMTIQNRENKNRYPLCFPATLLGKIGFYRGEEEE